MYKIALAGTPNAGKTTIFNGLTGSKQKVANWPGVTVEKKEGNYIYDNEEYLVVDLPGTYTLNAYSTEEKLASKYLVEQDTDITLIVCDTSSFRKSMYLASEILEIGKNALVVMNMNDVAKKKGIVVDKEKLEKELGVTAFFMSATKKSDLLKLKELIKKSLNKKIKALEIDYGIVEEYIEEISKRFNLDRYSVVKLFNGDPEYRKKLYHNEDLHTRIDEIRENIERSLYFDLEAYMIERRHFFINNLIKKCLVQDNLKKPLSEKIDNIVLNRYIGIPLFMLIMFSVFQLTFYLSDFFVTYISNFFNLLNLWVTNVGVQYNLPHWFISMLNDGVIGGVGSVVTFLPNIFIMFLFIAILEDVGYMARVAVVMDELMEKIGLQGKAFIPMILGFGCNVPAIMGTRVLEDEKSRLVTILAIPFMSCSARLPVYTLFAGVLFGRYGGLVVFLMYMIGIVVAILSIKVFKLVIKQKNQQPLLIELPQYHIPLAKNYLNYSWEKSLAFLKKAGLYILLASIIVWFLASVPFSAPYASKTTLIGRVGDFISPVFKLSGYGQWQNSVALLLGVSAKEIIVSSLGTLYGGDLQNKIALHFTPLSGFSFLVMILLYFPCLSTFITIIQETKKVKWALFSGAYTITVAFILSTSIYQIGRLLGFK